MSMFSVENMVISQFQTCCGECFNEKTGVWDDNNYQALKPDIHLLVFLLEISHLTNSGKRQLLGVIEYLFERQVFTDKKLSQRVYSLRDKIKKELDLEEEKERGKKLEEMPLTTCHPLCDDPA